jgi:hypothetical protein
MQVLCVILRSLAKHRQIFTTKKLSRQLKSRDCETIFTESSLRAFVHLLSFEIRIWLIFPKRKLESDATTLESRESQTLTLSCPASEDTGDPIHAKTGGLQHDKRTMVKVSVTIRQTTFSR